MSLVETLLEFFDAPATASFTLPPAEALAFFKSKGLKATFDWRDMLGEEHATAFTVAKMADLDLLADVQASLEDALAQGISFRSWSDTIIPVLQSKGWWGREAVTDPLTGETIVAQLGSPGRLKTIFRTNVQSSYAAGHWQQIQANKDVAEYLLYDAVDDHRTRPEHAAWDGTILPVDDDFWRTHYPPNGWNCRCGVIQLAEEELEDLGLTPSPKAPNAGKYSWTNPRTGKTLQVPKGLDPGWDTNPGARHYADLQKIAAEKIKAMPPATAKAAAQGLQATQEAAADFAKAQGLKAVPDGPDAATLTKGAGKAQLRAAQASIDKALAENTPYLAKAIAKVQGTKAGQAMDPVELLAKAQAEAQKVKDAAALANWKQAKLAGKPGAAAGQAVFDALPEPAQLALQAEIDAKVGATAAAKAVQSELEQIAAGAQGALPKANLATVLAENPGLSPAEVLAKVQAMPAKLTAGQQAGGLAGWKKNAIAGKPPTDKQQLAFDSLSDAQKAKVLEQVDAAKAAPPAPAAPIAQAPDVPPGPTPISDAVPDINPGQMVQIGPQKGSNPGGTYVDKATGTEWYVKFPASAEQARNEVLAAKLYEAAGIDVPDIRLVTMDGKTAIASRMEAGLTKGTPAALKKGGAGEGFAVDAWLGNWDVAGATLDNLLMRGARAFRVDTGGALRFRAQGTLKGAAWGDSVTEIQSLRNAGTAPQASKVFGALTDAEIEASVRRVLDVDDATIDRLVGELGPLDEAERKALARTLKARREDLDRQYPNARPAAPVAAPEPDGARVTAREQAEIEASRVNGYTIRTDGSEIEDQNVVVSQITSAAGKPVTRLFLKVREPGAKAISKTLSTQEGASLQLMREKTLSLLKSVNSRAAKGQPMDATVRGKWTEVTTALNSALDALEAPGLAPGPAKAMRREVEKLKTELVAFMRPQLTGTGPLKAFRMVDLDAFKDVAPAPVKGKAGGLPWQKRGAFEYELADFNRSNARLNGKKQQLAGTSTHYAIDEPGTRVRYVPAEGNAISSQGVVVIEVDGAGAAATAKGFEMLERIGVRATRSTEAERMELYLDRIAYIRTIRNSKLDEAYRAASSIADPAERNKAKLAALNADVGRDITKSRYWNPEGEHQAFGHGRVLLNRPDLDDKEVAAFAKTHVVYHNTNGLGVGGSRQWDRLRGIIEGGGQIGSQVDRVRRGVGSFGSSVSHDHTTGGANYIFTRLKSRTSTKGKAGLHWNPERLMRRTDAFSYTGDRFGNVDRNVQVQDRQIDPAGWKRAAAAGSNETNFRDSLSVFDDLERVVFADKAEYNEAIGGMRELGYRTWPDGRALEEVFDYEGSGRP
jgi:SPP1 gp7 family putative phage head morphogenesis protein